MQKCNHPKQLHVAPTHERLHVEYKMFAYLSLLLFTQNSRTLRKNGVSRRNSSTNQVSSLLISQESSHTIFETILVLKMDRTQCRQFSNRLAEIGAVCFSTNLIHFAFNVGSVGKVYLTLTHLLCNWCSYSFYYSAVQLHDIDLQPSLFLSLLLCSVYLSNQLTSLSSVT